jgi:hypothetical protein
MQMRLPVTYEDFQETLMEEQPPALWPETLQALWWDARGNWANSHNIAQDIPSKTGSWIHAYLHRKEGDEWNARYWYDRANRSFSKLSLEEELKQIVTWTLENHS